MVSTPDLAFTSHVGRDLLSSAGAFKNEAAAVWEYVVNSLQYVDQGVAPRVQVVVMPRKRIIEIHDNGSGMDYETLESFFTMHGENIERQRGRPGRGKFGTGKSAAFGIGKQFHIETRRNGKRNVIELFREDIENSSGGNVPVRHLVKDEPTQDANGTSITISEVFLKNVRTSIIIEYIERHLSTFRDKSPVVAINDHVCEYKEPDVVEEHVFKPTSKQAETLGDVTLTVKVARAPLDETDQGVRVTAGEGNLVGIEDCGISKKDYGSYVFGDIDVPAIETWNTPIQPYSDSRDLTLNVNHPVVVVLIGFLGSSLEQVRRGLVEKHKEAQKSEQARRLNAEASKIADILNNDFRGVQDRLNTVRSAASKSGPANSMFGSSGESGEEESAWVAGIDEPGHLERSNNQPNRTGAGEGRPNPDIAISGEQDREGQDSVSKAGGSGKKRKPKGGFIVDFEPLGPDADRSLYDGTSLRIIINLDHPVVKAAHAIAGSEDPAFRRLAYEIAFSEYAMALGYEMLGQDPEQPGDDLLYEVRSTLNRVSASAAALYR